MLQDVASQKPSWTWLSQPMPGWIRSSEHHSVMFTCTWLCGTPVGTTSVGAQESGFVGVGSVGIDAEEDTVSDVGNESDAWNVVVGLLLFEELLMAMELPTFEKLLMVTDLPLLGVVVVVV